MTTMVKVKLITDGGPREDILSGSTTLRQVYERFGVNYAHTTNMVESVPIKQGDLDKTLEQLSANDKLFMSSVTKDDNGAEIIIAGSMLLLKSSVKLEDWQKVLKFVPEFALYDDDDELYFKATISEDGSCCAGRHGVVFQSRPTEDGYACATLPVGQQEDMKAYVEDTLGQTLLNLIDLESEIPHMLEEAEKAHKEISEKIRFL